jgi:hypothetical protein
VTEYVAYVSAMERNGGDLIRKMKFGIVMAEFAGN